MKTHPFNLLLSVVVTLLTFKAIAQNNDTWPESVKVASITSTADSSIQKAMYYLPHSDNKTPLLVALHTWSGDYQQPMSIPYANWAIEKKWAFIHPDYHGPNFNPKSAGSDYVVQDILDAIQYMKNIGNINENRIYMMGGSGGGYNALQIVSRIPDIWAGVSAMVPISDLEAWYHDNLDAGRTYADDIVKATGGKPGASYFVDRQYLLRSPVFHLFNAHNVPIDIAAGIKDGHTGSVPVSHSLKAYNQLVDSTNQIPDSLITYLTQSASVPENFQFTIADSTYPLNQQPLFRRTTENVRITLFDGSHDILFESGLKWLEKQKKDKPASFE